MPESETSINNNCPYTPPSVHPLGLVPRSRQPDAPFFDDIIVTEFLRHWNIEWEDFDLSDAQKCARLPYYYTSKTKDVIELFDGCLNHDWKKLQEELKDLFWQYDRQKNISAALNQLTHDALSMDLNIYILKYAIIMDALMNGNEISVM